MNKKKFVLLLYMAAAISASPLQAQDSKVARDGQQKVDASSNHDNVIKSIPSPVANPGGLAWDGQYLWIGDTDDNMVYKLDPADGSVVESLYVAGGLFPTGLTWDGRYLWVAHSEGAVSSDLIARVDPATGLFTKYFGSPDKNPGDLAWDGRYLWNVDWKNEEIYKVDPDNGAVLQTLPAPGRNPAGLTRDGRYLWVGSREEGLIYKIDPIYGHVIASFHAPVPGPNFISGLTFDGTYLWSVNPDSDMISQHRADISSLTISPPSGYYASNQRIDLTLIVPGSGITITKVHASLDGIDITPTFSDGCSEPNLLSSGGWAIRCPVKAGIFPGQGSHDIEISVDLSNDTVVSDRATWNVIGN